MTIYFHRSICSSLKCSPNRPTMKMNTCKIHRYDLDTLPVLLFIDDLSTKLSWYDFPSLIVEPYVTS